MTNTNIDTIAQEKSHETLPNLDKLEPNPDLTFKLQAERLTGTDSEMGERLVELDETVVKFTGTPEEYVALVQAIRARDNSNPEENAETMQVLYPYDRIIQRSDETPQPTKPTHFRGILSINRYNKLWDEALVGAPTKIKQVSKIIKAEVAMFNMLREEGEINAAEKCMSTSDAMTLWVVNYRADSLKFIINFSLRFRKNEALTGKLIQLADGAASDYVYYRSNDRNHVFEEIVPVKLSPNCRFKAFDLAYPVENLSDYEFVVPTSLLESKK